MKVGEIQSLTVSILKIIGSMLSSITICRSKSAQNMPVWKAMEPRSPPWKTRQAICQRPQFIASLRGIHVFCHSIWRTDHKQWNSKYKILSQPWQCHLRSCYQCVFRVNFWHYLVDLHWARPMTLELWCPCPCLPSFTSLYLVTCEQTPRAWKSVFISMCPSVNHFVRHGTQF